MGAPAYLIDLTRLVSRQGHSTLTGIDRVELAWLSHLLTFETPLFALVRTVAGCLVLPKSGAQMVADMATGHCKPDRLDLLSRMTRRGNPARGRAEALLRQHAIARVAVWRLGAALRSVLPDGALYLNLGHSNLSLPVMRALKSVPKLRLAAMIHDTIPLDHPDLSRADAPAAFAAKLAAVAAQADLVIHLSNATRLTTETHLARLGRVPFGIVAPLGITVAAPDPVALPPGLDLSTPYYVALGTIEPRKNLSLLLDVWEKLSQDPAPVPRLFVLGSRGWADPSLLARLDARPKGVVELSGLTDPAVSALLCGARALLFPTLAEGFGLPPMEAAALGTPVIASDLPVIRELSGDYPVYLKPMDVYSWLETIRADAQTGNIGRTTQRPRLPTWEEHFQAVLTQA